MGLLKRTRGNRQIHMRYSADQVCCLCVAVHRFTETDFTLLQCFSCTQGDQEAEASCFTTKPCTLPTCDQTRDLLPRNVYSTECLHPDNTSYKGFRQTLLLPYGTLRFRVPRYTIHKFMFDCFDYYHVEGFRAVQLQLLHHHP